MFGFLFGLFGYVLFGPIGGLVFSLIGNALFGPKKKRQKIDDVQVQDVSYGSPLYYIWGTMRVGGTLFWPKELKLRSYVEEGKKGGILFFEYQKTPDVYTRQATWGIMFADCPYIYDRLEPIEAVQKITFDGVIVYDVSDDATAEFRSQSEALLLANKNGIRIYLGTDDYDIDPVILNSTEGSLPIAYYNRCYILFVNWILKDYGDNIPSQINAWLVRKGYRHPDTWLNKKVELPSIVWHSATVGWDRVYFMGGLQYDVGDDAFVECADCKGYELDDEGDWTLTKQHSLNQARFEHRSVLVTGTFNLFGSVTPRLVVMGGSYDYAAIATEFYDSDYIDGFMCEEFDGSHWFSCAIISDDWGITLGRKPFPRSAFGCCYYERHDGWHPYSRSTFVFCGRNSRAVEDGGCDYVGQGSSFQDCWAWNGGTWYLLTLIEENEGVKTSIDCGLGYRHYPASIQHGNYIYAGGGLTIDEGGNPNNARDVYKMFLFYNGEGGAFANSHVRFVCVCADILEMLDYDWPDKDYWCLAELISWRGYMVASLMNDQNNAVCLFRNVDGDGRKWEFWNRGKFTIVGYDNYIYKITGDHASKFTDEDTLTVVNETTLQHEKVVSATYDEGTNKTLITVEGIGVVHTGTLFIDYVSYKDCDDYYMKFVPETGGSPYPTTFSMTSYKGQIVLRGAADASDYTNIQTYITYPTVVESDDVQMKKVVEDVCALNGIESSLVDMSGLTSEMRGVVFDKGSGKSRIETLRQYGLFDLVQVDGIIKGVERGGEEVLEIECDDLGAAKVEEGGKTQPTDRALITYVNPNSVPLRIDYHYFDIDNDFQPGVQSSPIRDDATLGRRIVSVDVPIAMSTAKASQLAEILLFEASFPSIRIDVPCKYMRLIPTDPVSVITPTEEFRVITDSLSLNSDDIITIEGRVEDTTIYTETEQIGAGSGTYTPITAEGIALTGVFLDIPWIFGDDDESFYFGVVPTDVDDAPAFRGGELYYYDSSLDTPYIRLGVLNDYLDIGTIATAIPKSGTTGWDTINKPVVTMTLGTLSSSTEEGVLNGANLIAVGSPENGWEILSFVTAVDLGSSQYRLEGLLRYQFGTEHIVHENSETLVVLDSSKMIKPIPGIAANGLSLRYVVVSYGVLFGVAPSTSLFTCNFVCKKPFAPVHLEGLKKSDGSWMFTWDRRVRGHSNWMEGIEIPLREDFERYEVDFYSPDGSEVLHTRVIDVIRLNPDAKPYCILKEYGHNEYMEDGRTEYVRGQVDVYGSSVDSIKIAVYQISGSVGRGYGTIGEFTS